MTTIVRNENIANPVNDDENKNEKELVYLAVFEQIKECRDIISSLLIIYEFIREENISTTFNPSELRQFALSAAHNKTSTHLWHINALIATAQNFNDLLIGIEMCFEGWLGNKQSFIQHKYKQKVSKSQSQSKQKINTSSMIPKTEITSFVTSYYQPSINDNDDNEEQEESKQETDDDENIDFDINKGQEIVHINDENENINLNSKNKENENIDDDMDENEEFINKMKSYRGKISSPISFRMKQQKRMKQRERINYKQRYLNMNNNDNQKQLDFEHFDNTKSIISGKKNEADILSPFNISKFAKRVDLIPNDMDSPQFHRKNI